MSKGNRRQGREYALKIIYSFADQDIDLVQVLDEFWINFRFSDDVLGEALDEVSKPVSAEVRKFSEDLVNGVFSNLSRIDELIGKESTNWSLDRMSRVDLALLRLGAYEIVFCPEVPGNVVINEAIEIGKCYGTKDTPSFVNGILDKLSRTFRKTEK